MHIDIVSVIPELIRCTFEHSILRRAREKGLLEVALHDLREYGLGKYRQVDDYPYGGGAGMVLMPEPIANCLEALMAERTYDQLIFFTPDGQTLDQKLVNRLSLSQNLLMLAGHYKGVDERIRQRYITLEISVGDYVLSGGELPAAILTDALARLLPGVLGDETSALTDSFQDGLLAPPVYTRPADFRGMKVPDVLLSGHHKAIENWRHEQALKRTRERRPDLLDEDEQQ
ncbi:MAG TPA: tRNA (guanosine(37)-N1)-methyltransferase TrmD [Phaeodactylibacter sp.]|nr:tRNA (guanosine(37)-N1)-methyltransferase TrmD [Phaeodactylibacter sp.]